MSSRSTATRGSSRCYELRADGARRSRAALRRSGGQLHLRKLVVERRRSIGGDRVDVERGQLRVVDRPLS